MVFLLSNVVDGGAGLRHRKSAVSLTVAIAQINRKWGTETARKRPVAE